MPAGVQPKIGEAPADLWASSVAGTKKSKLRRFIWQLHPIGALVAVVFVMVTVGEDLRSSVVLLSAIYSVLLAGLMLVGTFSSSSLGSVLLGLLDVWALTAVAYLAPSLWYSVGILMVSVVSIGWVESRQITAAILGAAVTSMALTGYIAGIENWSVAVASLGVLGAVISIMALWSDSDAPLGHVAEALDSLRVVVWQSDEDGTITEAFGHVEMITGLAPSQMVGMSLTEIVDLPDRNQWRDLSSQLVEQGNISLVHELNAHDEVRTVRASVRRVEVPGGLIFRGVTVDISEDWASGETKRRHASIVEHMRDGLVILNRGTSPNALTIDSINDSAKELLNIADSTTWPEIQTAFPLLAEQVLVASHGPEGVADDEVWAFEIVGDVDQRWLEFSIIELSDNAIAAQITDVTDRKIREAQIEYQATHDGLTGLLNATEFRRRLEEHRAEGNAVPWVFVIDLDRFKPVNDQHGHSAGDEVLTVMAQRLRSCLKATDPLARMGGDEFVAFVDGTHSLRDATRIATRIEQTCSEPVDLGPDLKVRVSASVGFARPEPAASTAEAIDSADQAMYARKQAIS